MKAPILQITNDGSSTLFSPDLNECYHSVNGAITESIHVFIHAGLDAFHSLKEELNILEIGFGTGLNALLTMLEADKIQKTIHYTSIELFPVSHEITTNLNYENADGLFSKMHECEWNQPICISNLFFLNKICADFTTYQFEEKYDVVYFDAFSPDVQPEMWTEDIFQKLFDCMNTGGIMTTYCAKGQVRRNMQHAGFKTERLPGPPGKREMLRGTKS